MNRRRWSIGLAAVAATILVAVLALSQSPTKLVDDIRGHGKTRSVKPVALSTTSSIAGTVRDQAGSPIAGARVCAQTKDRETACAPTAVDGTYTIEYLFPLAYEVTAYAPTLQPGRYHPDGDVRRDRFVLAAAERRTGVDIVLEGGAVELTGKVLDIGGGPIGRANVRVAREDFDINEWRHWYPAVETADDGSFRLWVAPGDHQIEATADGYAHVEHEAIAPGSIDLLLTPAGSIAGTIVDRDNQPVADALVVADAIDVHVQARSDDGGHFLIEGLVPMRYDVSARTTTGYGTAVGSVLVGLGAHVDGIIIRVDPAAHIVGRVLTAPPATLCPPADVLVKLHDPFGEDVEMSVAADGTLHADGVIASTYYALVSCRGYYTPEHYPPIVVGDRDLSLTWPVSRGGTLRGHLRTTEGTPLTRGFVTLHDTDRSIGGYARADGSYEITGIPHGDYEAWASTADYAITTAKVSIGPGTTEKDFEITPDATIKGIVVDPQGHPVSDIEVRAEANGLAGPLMNSRVDGTFTLNVQPGTYEVYAAIDWQHPLGFRQTVATSLDKPAFVRLSVPAQDGTITGDVVDAHGHPIGDAYVYASTPSFFDLDFPIGLNEHPTVTRPDGTFTITGLGPGPYTVTAQREGGGSTRAKGIEVGSKVSLVFPTTGSLAGRVSYTDKTHPDQMRVTVRDGDGETRFYRDQRFYHTDGVFTLDELPGGTLTIAVSTADGLGLASVLLSPGEQRKDVAITLDRSSPVTGRLVDSFTHRGAPGYFIIPRTTRAQVGTIVDYTDLAHQTDAMGDFSVLAPPGEGTIEITTPNPRDRSYCAPPHPVNLRGPTHLGDIPIVRPRVELGGDVGFTLGGGRVDSLDPKGPAAAAGLQMGDIITAVDGVGPSSLVEDCGFAMIAVAPGSVLSLTRASGDTIKVTAGPVPPGSEIEIDK